MRAPLILPSRKTPDREEWWVQEVKTGKLYGPFGPGAIWFETPRELRGVSRLALQNRADLLLSEAAVGWERLQKALAFLQVNGVRAYRDFMERGIEPRQTPALVGMRGGTDTRAYLGDAAATGEGGLHVDDSKDNTTIAGLAGGAAGIGNQVPGADGSGQGRGSRGGAGNVTNQGGGGGSGYGTAGGNGQGGTQARNAGIGGAVCGEGKIIDALRQNSFTQAILECGSSGGGGGGDDSGNGAAGAAGATSLIRIANGTLTISASITQTGIQGGAAGGAGAGSGGSSAGGLVGLCAATIVQSAGTIDVSGGAAQTTGIDGGLGGNGRIDQVYFDAKASLTVAGATENQYRILRSVPGGMPTYL